MRTTLTLDADVIRLIEDRVHQDRISMKRVVNEALRRGLSDEVHGTPEPYRMTTYPGRLRPGLDIGSLNRLADEIEDAEIIRTDTP